MKKGSHPQSLEKDKKQRVLNEKERERESAKDCKRNNCDRWKCPFFVHGFLPSFSSNGEGEVRGGVGGGGGGIGCPKANNLSFVVIVD